jgi:hypothetical protein
MIQRIQTIYLLLSAVLSGGLIWFVDLWRDNDGISFFVIDGFQTESMALKVMSALFFLAAVLSIYTLFKYKVRQTQFVLGRLIILINFIILGILVYFSLMLPGEIQISEKGIGLLIPIFSIVMVVLANKAIKKDEELVKSVDRLR